MEYVRERHTEGRNKCGVGTTAGAQRENDLRVGLALIQGPDQKCSPDRGTCPEYRHPPFFHVPFHRPILLAEKAQVLNGYRYNPLTLRVLSEPRKKIQGHGGLTFEEG